MPLLDHFHAPLHPARQWESFYSQWAVAIAGALNRAMPEGYFAETQPRHAPLLDTDVAAVGVDNFSAVRELASPADAVLPGDFPPSFGVNVFEMSAGYTLVAAVELVGPRNKDRAAARRAFTAKCVSPLSRGLGLTVIDVVTGRRWRLFPELLGELCHGGSVPWTGLLTAASYRPMRVEGVDSIEVRVRTLEVGGELPTLPLSLGGVGHVDLDLEAAYEEARTRSRIP